MNPYEHGDQHIPIHTIRYIQEAIDTIRISQPYTPARNDSDVLEAMSMNTEMLCSPCEVDKRPVVFLSDVQKMIDEAIEQLRQQQGDPR
jgi:hypothetical protein